MSIKGGVEGPKPHGGAYPVRVPNVHHILAPTASVVLPGNALPLPRPPAISVQSSSADSKPRIESHCLGRK
ncbi:hypothetical protein TIFTF001_023502 [Ficus carica]|uniref:Uncharacterized protein n=1 Tax=Ficus carica TaxID=3494 RepID=A0AA88AUP3_FICCA|nr:hypothetical protein TIFTF001_023502 [Ficus carica]